MSSGEHAQRREEVDLGVLGDAPMDHLVEELRRAADYQAALAARVRASYAGETREQPFGAKR